MGALERSFGLALDLCQTVFWFAFSRIWADFQSIPTPHTTTCCHVVVPDLDRQTSRKEASHADEADESHK
jgi:hypothetical protein